MTCAWDAYLSLLPLWIRKEVAQRDMDKLIEVRLRLGLPPMLVYRKESCFLNRICTTDDLMFCVNIASKFSPWASSTLKYGYITGKGGHRVGVCGSYVDSDRSIGIKEPGMLNLRVARDVQGVSKDLAKYEGSILILGRPGSGKTTLLRDLIRKRSNLDSGFISVIDEREELFPKWDGKYCFDYGPRTDIMSGCSKKTGVLMLLRNMTPTVIAVDEITGADDCEAISKVGWCGVSLYATAHASSVSDLYARPIYKPIIQSGIFQNVIIMHEDKSWHLERMNI